MCRIGGMKYLFGIDSKGGCASFERFKIRSLDKEDEEKLNRLKDEFEKSVKKAYPPFALVALSYLGTAYSGVIIFAMLLSQDGFLKALEDRWWILLAAGLVFSFSLFFSIKFARQSKKADKSKKLKDQLSEFEIFSAEADLKLGVPVGPFEIDVVCPYVKNDKKGNDKMDPLSLLSFVNVEFRFFEEGDGLCIADLSSVIALPSSGMKSLSYVNKKITLPMWNKDKGIKSSKYKPYGITYSNGIYRLRGYWELIYQKDEEEYSIMVPSYDGETFVNLIKGLRPDLLTGE